MAAQLNGDARKRPASPSSENYCQRRERVLGRQTERCAAAAGLGALSAAEQELEQSVLRPALSAADIDPAKNFLDFKRDYDSSALLSLLQRMPKGGVLHTHGIASGDFNVLAEAIRTNGHFYVWQGGDSKREGLIRSFGEGVQVEEGWVPARICSQERLYDYLTLSPGLPNVEACWNEFGMLWERIHGVACVAPFYFGKGGLFWDTLTRCMKAKVAYVEIKEPLFAPWTEYDGETEVPFEEVMKLFRDTVDTFCKENPGFIGARMVMTCLKIQSEDAIRTAFRQAVDLKEKFPDLVAGFDLAGPEDVFEPINVFAAVLEEEHAAARARGIDLPLLLHAGETNVPEATQIFDAVALRCERVGHGFALARHPALLEEVLASGISLECCPISNQVLGYCPNLANHAVLGLFRAGVPVTISPDDPGMWHYSDVSYDFAAVAKAWNLGLIELKALARNSLICSTLRGEQKEKALTAWGAEWDLWVKEELSKNGQAS